MENRREVPNSPNGGFFFRGDGLAGWVDCRCHRRRRCCGFGRANGVYHCGKMSRLGAMVRWGGCRLRIGW